MALYKRGGAYHYDFSVNGKRYRGTTKESVFTRARQVESLLMVQARNEGAPALNQKAPMLFEFANRFLGWVASSPLEPNSKAYYQNGWRLIQTTGLPQMRMDRITPDEVSSVRFSGSAANANNALRTLRRMFGKAEEWGVVSKAPRIKLAKEYGRSAVIDKAAEGKLLAVASQPLRDVLSIILDTGMRPAEVFALRWENVNWERRTIFVPNGKTRNARRFVPISERVQVLLLARFTGGGFGWVFPSESKTGHLESVTHAFSTARAKAGLSKDLVLYSARHTFATDSLAATGNLAVVMRAMGHSDAKTAMVYQHPQLEGVRIAINKRNESQCHNSRHNAIM